MNNQFLISVFFLFSLDKSFAQINESDTLKFGYKLTTTGTIQSGNVRQVVINSGMDILHYSPKISLRTINSNLYQTLGDKKADENFISKNFIYYGYPKSIYPYLMGWFETNYRRKIDFRYQAGPGVSFRVLNTKQQLLKLSVTGTFEHTGFAKIYSFEYYNKITNEINTWRVTARFYGRTNIVKNKLNLSYELWYQQSVKGANNYRYHYEALLALSLSQKLNFITAVNGSYENIIPIGLRHDDFKLTFGITFGNLNN